MLKQQGNNEETPLVNSKQDLGKIFMRQSSNKFNVSLQILCLSQDVFCLFVFSLSLDLFHLLCTFVIESF